VAKPKTFSLLSEAASCTPLSADNPTTWWYESVTHNGQSSFMSSTYKSNYVVFRNVVTDYGADNTGASDASAAIQNAINGEVMPKHRSHPTILITNGIGAWISRSFQRPL
jgi:hypothetical protein